MDHNGKRPSESVSERCSLGKYSPPPKRHKHDHNGGGSYSGNSADRSFEISSQSGTRKRSLQSSKQGEHTHETAYRSSRDNLDLKRLLAYTPGQAIHELYVHFRQFEHLIRSIFHDNQTLIEIVKILSHIIKVKKIGKELKKILNFVLSDASLEGFLFSLTLFICRMPMIGDMDQRNEFPNILQAVITVFDFLLTVYPQSNIAAENLPVDVCFGTAKQLSLRGSHCFQDIGEKAQQLFDKRNKICTEIYESRVSISSQSQLNELSIALPTPADLRYQPNRTPNIVSGAFPSVKDYLKIQRDLLREDFINPFRTALNESVEHSDNKFTGASFIDEQVLTSSGNAAHKVSFNASFKQINWKRSKSFENGNLVCFSEDNFNTVFYATAALRNVKNLERGILIVELLSRDEQSLPKSRHLKMIESPGYFKGYAPVIEKLHKIAPENLPFSQYLVNVQNTIDQPKYLRDVRPIFNLKGVVCKCDEGCLHSQVNILKRDSWESLDTPILDASQKYALHLALTNEVALIQGPPGTGKSYIGLKAIRALLQNAHFWRHSVQEGTCPIMVVCYTNHALDQFLEGVINLNLDLSKKDIVRVGRQCKSAKVEQFNLYWKVQQARRQLKYSFLKDFQPNVRTKAKALNEFLNGEFVSEHCHLYCNFLSQDVVFDLKDYCNISFPFQCDEGMPLQFACWLDVNIQPQDEAHRSINEERWDDENFESNKLYAVLGEEGLKKVVQKFKKLPPMTRQQARKYLADHLHQPKITERLPLLKHCLIKLLDEFQELKEVNSEQKGIHNRRTKEIKVTCLQEAKIIGLTTTGAARESDLLSKVQSKILIVEEAAEVLEPQLIATLTKHTQHLILIGDHKQLRPKTNDTLFGKTHKLDISLFERLVTNGLHHATLQVQHRMRPEISRIVSDHIYDKKLIDHDDTKTYEDVKGVKYNLYFINHDKEESNEDPELKSYSNLHEAQFMACFCKYLLQQEYEADQITVVTPYKSQEDEIKYQLKQVEAADVRITTIDNYQGEENDVILLSLVRSNKKKIPGFVKDENRICVALSRARQGFYCIGDFQLFQECSDLWSSIINDVKSRGFFGDSLELVCSQHKVETKVSCADDFEQVPDGGCNRPCEERYKECDHRCLRKCHPDDRNHDLPCKHPCPKMLQPCGHPCTKKCGEECDKMCVKKVERELLCGHREKVECCLDEFRSVQKCRHPCRLKLACGHNCSGACGMCHQGRLHVPCKKVCKKILLCGHTCSAGHPCSSSCPPCFKDCAYECPHSKCGACFHICKSCDHQCRWKCQHEKCTKLCGEPCDRDRCDMLCTERLKPCGHPCLGLCGELCPPVCDHPKCNTIEEKVEIIYNQKDELDNSAEHRYIQLRDCKHIFAVHALDKWMERRNDEPVSWKFCPVCRVPVMRTLRYVKIVNQILHDMNELKKRENRYLGPHRRTQMKLELSVLAPISVVKFGSLSSINFEQERDEVLQKKYLSTISELDILQVRNGSAKLLEKLRVHENISDHITRLKSLQILQSQAITFLEWIESIENIQDKLSDQMILDLITEHKRLLLLLKCYRLQYALSAKTDTVKHCKVLEDIQLSCENNSTKLDCEEYQAKMVKLQTIQTEHGVQIVGENEGNIIHALGLKADGWYKCSHEHYYNFNDAINEYDGNCPECCLTQASNYFETDVEKSRIEYSDNHIMDFDLTM